MPDVSSGTGAGFLALASFAVTNISTPPAVASVNPASISAAIVAIHGNMGHGEMICSMPPCQLAWQFLRDHIEAVFFDHGRITVVGSVNDLRLPFRTEGQIDRASIHLDSGQKANEPQRRARLEMISLQGRPISRLHQVEYGRPMVAKLPELN
jgi:hypothetical protein